MVIFNADKRWFRQPDYPSTPTNYRVCADCQWMTKMCDVTWGAVDASAVICLPCAKKRGYEW